MLTAALSRQSRKRDSTGDEAVKRYFATFTLIGFATHADPSSPGDGSETRTSYSPGAAISNHFASGIRAPLPLPMPTLKWL